MEGIKDVLWLTHGQTCIGIVAKEDKYDGMKYYLGVGAGIDEESDKECIAKTGSKITPEMIKSFFERNK